MKSKKLIVVEQYISWPGHYKKYFENLISEKYDYIYSAVKDHNYPKSVFIPEAVKYNNSNFIDFIKGRFLNSFKAYDQLIKESADVAHLVEFEPFSFFYLLLFKRKKIPKLIITVHSIERMKYASRFKDLVSTFQRLIYSYTLREAASLGGIFVTHYQHHKNQLIDLIGSKYYESILLIPYPCPKLKIDHPVSKKLTNKKLLIYGQIREDKGIFEFLSIPGTEKLEITIAGPVLDKRILQFEHHNITFYNKYFNEEDDDLKQLVNSHSFMLLPYIKSYTGGSGTLKDSISFGLPVIVSAIPTFKEVVQEGKVGFVYENVEEIINFTQEVTELRYSSMVENCFKYAKTYDWNYMRQEYFKLYNQALSDK